MPRLSKDDMCEIVKSYLLTVVLPQIRFGENSNASLMSGKEYEKGYCIYTNGTVGFQIINLVRSNKELYAQFDGFFGNGGYEFEGHFAAEKNRGNWTLSLYPDTIQRIVEWTRTHPDASREFQPATMRSGNDAHRLSHRDEAAKRAEKKFLSVFLFIAVTLLVCYIFYVAKTGETNEWQYPDINYDIDYDKIVPRYQ
jgi:hypothetical protein